MVSPNFHPYLGGAENQALELSKTLLRDGVRVRVLTRRPPGLPGEAEVAGIPVSRLSASGSGLLNAAAFMLASFAELLKTRRSHDVIHVHLAGSPAIAACLAGALTRKPVVVKVGGGRGIGEIALSSRTLAGRLKLALLRRLNPRFVPVTDDLAAEMREHGLSAGIRVIPNGVDTGRFVPAAPEARIRRREELGWPDGPVFLYVGRLAPEKRLPAFIDSLGAAARRSPERPFLFALAGTGPEEDAVRRAAESAGLAGRVRLLGAVEDTAGLYAAADVFVLPSVSEGLSNALLEAMASGLAVLASAVGGTREAVRDGEDGLLFAPADTGAAARQAGRFLEEPGLARRLGASARARAEDRYSLAAVAGRYLKLYNEPLR